MPRMAPEKDDLLRLYHRDGRTSGPTNRETLVRVVRVVPTRCQRSGESGWLVHYREQQADGSFVTAYYGAVTLSGGSDVPPREGVVWWEWVRRLEPEARS